MVLFRLLRSIFSLFRRKKSKELLLDYKIPESVSATDENEMDQVHPGKDFVNENHLQIENEVHENQNTIENVLDFQTQLKIELESGKTNFYSEPEPTNKHEYMNRAIPANEFEYLEQLILYRLDRQNASSQDQSATETSDAFDPVEDFPPLEKWILPFEKFADENSLTKRDDNGHYKNRDELLLLLIALTPHLKPDLFDRCISEKLNGSDYPNIGGVRGKNCRFFLPTGETALFVLAGDDFDRRLQIKQLFGAEHLFWQKKIIWLEDMQNNEPAMHGKLVMSPDYVDRLTYGIHQSPQFSISFPAKKIAPFLNSEKHRSPTFDDLVIPEELKEQVNELKSWLTYNDELMNRFGMRNRLKKGYRALFYGPSGTGKTFTAEILGNHLNKDVYKIDLSMVVSKYIGETEKNLELLFARAEDKEWILFFDEADALFGKRTNVRDAHDKYANQEVSYLLQRIEDYDGLVILATNMKNNIDDAFTRRFNSIMKFPFPDSAQRVEIWKKALPQNALFKKKLLAGDPPEVMEVEADIPELVKKYELTGGNIINVVQYACLKAVEVSYKSKNRKENTMAQVNTQGKHSSCCQDENENPLMIIYLADVLDGIKRELIKEGKPFSL